MKPDSTDLRLRIVQAYEDREGAMRRLATTFRVSLSCVRRLLTQHRETGRVAPKPHGGGYPAQVEARGLAVVQGLVQAAPDATLSELCQRFPEVSAVPISMATMSRVVAKLQRTRTKHFARHGTSARRRAAAAGRLPRGEPRA